MIKQIRIVLSLIICLVFVGTLGTVPKAQASPAIPPQPQQIYSKNGDVVTINASESDMAAAAALTLEARQAAKPFALTTVKPADFSRMPNNAVAGSPGAKAGGLPNPAALAKAQTEFPDAWQALNNRQSLNLPTLQAPSLEDTYGTKNTYTGYYGNYYDPFWLNYPYMTVGKLYFTDGYSTYTCTASIISPYNVIVTAAHCVFNTDYNYWYSGWVFVPADYGGYAPLGAYGWYSAHVMTNWMSASKSSAGMPFDIATINLNGDPEFYTGWLGTSWNWSYTQLHHAIGYPSNLYNGISSYICVAESFKKATDVLGMGCDMTYGSSGGPWIRWFMPYTYNGNYVNSVVSGGTPGTPTFYGARFSTKNFIPLCIVAGC